MNDVFEVWYNGLEPGVYVLSDLRSRMPESINWISTYQFNRAFDQAGGKCVTAGVGARYVRNAAPSLQVRIFKDRVKAYVSPFRESEQKLEPNKWDILDDWCADANPGKHTLDEVLLVFHGQGEDAPSKRWAAQRLQARGWTLFKTGGKRYYIKPEPKPEPVTI